MPSEFGEEGERGTKDCGVRSDKTVFTWQDLSKFNQKHNAYVAVRGKVSITVPRIVRLESKDIHCLP